MSEKSESKNIRPILPPVAHRNSGLPPGHCRRRSATGVSCGTLPQFYFSRFPIEGCFFAACPAFRGFAQGVGVPGGGFQLRLVTAQVRLQDFYELQFFEPRQLLDFERTHGFRMKPARRKGKCSLARRRGRNDEWVEKLQVQEKHQTPTSKLQPGAKPPAYIVYIRY